MRAMKACERKTPETMIKQLRATNVDLVNKNSKLEAEGERLTQRMAEAFGENTTLQKKLNDIQFKFWVIYEVISLAIHIFNPPGVRVQSEKFKNR